MKFPSLAAGILLASVACPPVAAAMLQYTLTGNDLDGTIEYASFQLDSNPVILPNNVGPGEGFRVKFVSGFFQYGSTTATLQDVQFFNGNIGGGFFNLDPTDKTGSTSFLNVGGPQLYSGSEVVPALLTGSFAVFDVFSGAPLSLTVASAAAVPEPATWAMMISGFGLTGAALRTRRKPGRSTPIKARIAASDRPITCEINI